MGPGHISWSFASHRPSDRWRHAGGTLAAILSSTAAGAAAVGLGGALIGLGFSKEEADYYNSQLEVGRTVVTVSAGSRRSEAESVLRNFGSYDITRKDDDANNDYSISQSTERNSLRTSSEIADASKRAGSIGASTVGAGSVDIDLTRGGSSSAKQVKKAKPSDQEGHMTAYEEELRIDKNSVETGSVNVRKEVHTEHKRIDVPVQREEVVIQRRPASGHVGDLGSGQQEIHIPIREEQVKVDKQMVAKEDVVVSKREVQDTERVDEILRKEEIKVDRNTNAKSNDRRSKNS